VEDGLADVEDVDGTSVEGGALELLPGVAFDAAGDVDGRAVGLVEDDAADVTVGVEVESVGVADVEQADVAGDVPGLVGDGLDLGVLQGEYVGSARYVAGEGHGGAELAAEALL